MGRFGRVVVFGTLCALASSSPAAAATFVVTKTADTADGACDADCSLREAVIAANANPGLDGIDVPAGAYVLAIGGAGEDAAATGDLDVTEAVRIVGAGRASTIVDGAGLDRVFHVLATLERVELRGLTIRGGAVTGNGDAGAGGGVAGYRADVVVIDCVLTENAAREGGGAYVSTINTEQGRASIQILGSDVTLNEASGNAARGGGVSVGSYARGLVSRSTIANNTVVGAGGGLACGGLTEVDVRSSTISGNTANTGGGVWSNTSLRCMIRGSIVEGNTASSTGGGIAFPGDVSVIASVVRNNTAQGGGGGIANPFAQNSGNLLIEDSTVTGNSSSTASGGIGNFGGTITIRRSAITDNSAVTFGGGMGMSGGTVVIENTTFSDNSVSSATGDNGIRAGGGIAMSRFSGRNVTLRHVTFADNTAPVAGAQIACSFCGEPTNVTIVNTLVSGSGVDNCDGAFVSAGGNVDTGATCNFMDPSDRVDAGDAMLGALAENGGLTETRALLAGSPAIGAALELDPRVENDQRGVRRDGAPDAGAFERIGGALAFCAGDLEGVSRALRYGVEELLDADVGDAVACLGLIVD